MVTVEQGGGLEQAGGTTDTQTQNPQNIPSQTNLQPNGGNTSNLQGVISTNDLLGTAGANAVITIPGGNNTTAESLLASEKAPQTTPAHSNKPLIVWGGLGLVVLLFVSVMMMQMNKSTFKQ